MPKQYVLKQWILEWSDRKYYLIGGSNRILINRKIIVTLGTGKIVNYKIMWRKSLEYNSNYLNKLIKI